MNILQMLQASEPALLTALAEVWSVRLDPRADVAAMVDGLFRAMTDPERAEAVWDMLDDKARGALQMLIGSGGGAMPEAKFVRVFGDIRRMGEGKIRSEQPHKHPASAAEALYYRGLIGFSFENADTGPRTIVFVPTDLVGSLPVNKTAYSNLKDEGDDLPEEAEEGAAALDPLDASEVTSVRAADTSLVDDVTTLLAYLRIHAPYLEGDTLAGADAAALGRHLLTDSGDRLRFMLALAFSADLIEVNGGRAAPSRTGAPRWLGKSRSEQVKILAEAWKISKVVVDLWHVPGLRVDATAGTMQQYNAQAARAAVLEIMTPTLPTKDWWAVDDFVELVREDSADFQRPNGDFDSWYIYDDGGTLLEGIDNWHAVEGAMLDYLITAPMHWLGLVDLADEAARLTVYGRAFLGMNAYPNKPDEPDALKIDNDGTLHVSRKVSRADRYQVARFSTWVSAGNVYTYKLDRAGVAQAESQGINAGHISAFIKRALGDKPIPDAINRLLEGKQAAAAAANAPTSATVTVERLLVLRTTAPETLDFIVNTPALRRYTGARLGDMAVVVLKTADPQAFADALAEHGIKADFLGG